MISSFFTVSGIANKINRLSYDRLVIIADTNTYKLCYPKLANLINQKIILQYKVKAGEHSKNLNTCTKIWSFLNLHQITKNDLILGLGGGVVCDITGFVAATYKRGIPLIFIPTSLMAMVDASIGYKNGINLNHIKNNIGTFYKPKHVWVCFSFLDTLPYKELLNGFAEMIKHSALQGVEELTAIQTIDLTNIKKLEAPIKQSINFKYELVIMDPSDLAERQMLNFGHTIGHAIEAYHHAIKSKISHGEAIAIGMYYETKLSLRYLHMPKDHGALLLDILLKFFQQPIQASYTIHQLAPYLFNDKKNNQANQINFSLLAALGHASIKQKLTLKQIQSVLPG